MRKDIGNNRGGKEAKRGEKRKGEVRERRKSKVRGRLEEEEEGQ